MLGQTITSHAEHSEASRDLKGFFCFPLENDTQTFSRQSPQNDARGMKAFTLAEVLITLGIIGIIASLTIPTLMNKIHDNQYKTAYKKAYSTLYQALNKANSEKVLDSASGAYDLVHLSNFVKIMSYVKLQEKCINYDSVGVVQGGNTKCWAPDAEGWHSLSNNGYPQKNVDIAVIDSSGMSWGICARGYFASYAVDINGLKKPNQMGKDRFIFVLKDINDSNNSGLPIKVNAMPDNESSICEGSNKCATEKNYYGTTWLYK